jgi:hypothetical protein
MKYRVLDVMGDVLGLVKKSDLGGATALLRKALSGETLPVLRRRLFRCRPGARWAKPCALFAPGRSCPKACPTRPSPGQRGRSANDS